MIKFHSKLFSLGVQARSKEYIYNAGSERRGVVLIVFEYIFKLITMFSKLSALDMFENSYDLVTRHELKKGHNFYIEEYIHIYVIYSAEIYKHNKTVLVVYKTMKPWSAVEIMKTPIN